MICSRLKIYFSQAHFLFQRRPFLSATIDLSIFYWFRVNFISLYYIRNWYYFKYRIFVNKFVSNYDWRKKLQLKYKKYQNRKNSNNFCHLKILQTIQDEKSKRWELSKEKIYKIPSSSFKIYYINQWRRERSATYVIKFSISKNLKWNSDERLQWIINNQDNKSKANTFELPLDPFPSLLHGCIQSGSIYFSREKVGILCSGCK